MQYFLLAVLWVLWCALHSLLISVTVTALLKRRLGDGYRFFRLLFNLFAVLSLLPLLAYAHSLAGEAVMRWSGIGRLVQVPMLGLSLWLFVAGARVYDMRQFLGTRQIVEHKSTGGLTASGSIDTSGILGRVRHPWYGGALLLLWFRSFDGAGLVTNSVLSLYLVAGAFLEERKLVMEFGEEYERYRRTVPMLFPRLRRGTHTP